MAGSNEVNSNECKSVVPLNTWVLISNFKLAYNLLRRPDGTFNRDLAEFLDRKVPANASPVDGVISFDVIIDRSTNLLSRVYRPAPAPAPAGADASLAAPAAFLAEIERPLSAAPVPVIVFFHGGSFAHSSSNSAIYDSLCRRFVSMCGAVVVSVSYRRSPEFRFPCAYDDGWAALKWASTRPWLRSGRDSKVRIFLAGDSSGGNIAHTLADLTHLPNTHYLVNNTEKGRKLFKSKANVYRWWDAISSRQSWRMVMQLQEERPALLEK